MPFSELLGFAKGKVDDGSQKRSSNLSADLSFQSESDCCELVWENGQIVMRNQSIRDRKGSSSNNLPSFGSSKDQDAKNSKGKLFSSTDQSVLSDFPLSAPPCDVGFEDDDNMVPWLSCPAVAEPYNYNVYCPEVLPESFVVTAGNEFTHSSSTANSLRLQQGSMARIPSSAPRSSFSQSQRHAMPRSGNGSNADFKDSTPRPSHKINAGQPNNNASGLLNFSYFSRFASLSGANTRNTATIPPEQSSAISRSPDRKCEKSSDKTCASMPTTKLVVGGEKAPEPVVATSSVCSGNSLERDSNDPANSLKRKCRETEDSEGPSEEVEEESVGIHKTGRRGHNRAGSKRSRAAEVHNLSERRRRERINEKMRSLQELIPNCNKVDKASMLDEAIEYLKALQVQVQILSMGTGMYISQMMLPGAMQHMHRAHMSQFSPMGIGMGFGMSMHDMNSMMQMPSIQGPCFPVSGLPISNSSGFYGPVSSSQQGLGHLGQGLSASIPHAPLPLTVGIPMRAPMGNVLDMPGMADVLANNATHQGPNQATIALNDQSQAANVDAYKNANAMSHTKHS